MVDSLLVTLWITTWVAIAIIVLRLVLHRYSASKFDLADWLALISIFWLALRLPSVHIATLYGTNNISVAERHNFDFTADEISHLMVGSILSLVNRILYTTFLWFQIAILLNFYSRTFGSLKWVKRAVTASWYTLGVSYLAVAIATFTECHPIYLYWAVTPNPDNCVRADVQLFLQGVLCIILELMLLLISFPVIFLIQRPLLEKLRIGALLGLGMFSIAITAIRLPMTFNQDSSQRTRTFWASLQTLASCAVANIPMIYGRIQIGRRKKTDLRLNRLTSRSDSHKEEIEVRLVEFGVEPRH